MFQAATADIVVSVEPSYLADESRPEDGHWTFGYRITIENCGPVAVQLLSRRWIITDGRGTTREVTGRGVVGQQPVIPPGGRFEYASGCPLSTPSGIMVGSYVMMADDGRTIEVAIPAFPLDVPDQRRTLN